VEKRIAEAWVRFRQGPGKASDEGLRRGLAILETLGRPVYGLADPELNGWIAAGGVPRAERLLGEPVLARA
jgi:hypothetical protein